MSKVTKPEKKQHLYVVSKRTPTQLNPRVQPVISEQHDTCFAVTGNVVQVYSLTTGNLINTLRSNRIGEKEDDQRRKGDVHKSNIVALALLESKVLIHPYPLMQLQLISLCSKGVWAEWDVPSGDLLNFEQVLGLSKIQLATITSDFIACYGAQQGIFKVLDTTTKNVVAEFDKLETPAKVRGLKVVNKTLAYIQGRSAVTHDLTSKQATRKIIQREALLTSLALNQQGNMMALADEFGKVYLVHNFNSQKQLFIQTLHWHAHAVNTLAFIPNSTFLLSGGEEAVLVQWHLETQDKTFISRVGNPILNISLSEGRNNIYSLTMKDNSFKVIRFDNNKTLVNVRHLKVDTKQEQEVTHDGKFVSAIGSDIMFYDLNQSHRFVQTLAVKAQNFASSTYSTKKTLPGTKVKSFCLTPDQKTIVTLEDLTDSNGCNKEIRIQALKFWYRQVASDDPSDFRLVQFIHDPSSDVRGDFLIEAIDNNLIATANSEEIKIWQQVTSGKWVLLNQFSYQGMKVRQVVANVKLRLGTLKNKDGNHPRCLAVLHKGGYISFWNQHSWSFVYLIKLNKDSKKVIFETSSRYLVALSQVGSVEVWNLKGKTEHHSWDLNFKSVGDIINNDGKENQFFVTMNQDDVKEGSQNAVLMFQFSRPQNLVMYWKLQLPLMKAFFVNTDPCFLLIVNINQEMQRIYCGVTRGQLKTVANKKRMSVEYSQRTQEKQAEQVKQADYQFISQKPVRRLSEHRERETLVGQQEAQIMRLDKADRVFEDSEFAALPSLGFCLQQLAGEMLNQPSQAHNLVDLQAELNMEMFNRPTEKDDVDMEAVDEAKMTDRDLYEQIEGEMTQMFSKLLK